MTTSQQAPFGPFSVSRTFARPGRKPSGCPLALATLSSINWLQRANTTHETRPNMSFPLCDALGRQKALLWRMPLFKLPKTTITQTHRRVYSFPKWRSNIKYILQLVLAGGRLHSPSPQGETGIQREVKVISPGFLKTTGSKVKIRSLCIPVYC